ncbi:MAG: acyltransferase family protein [Porphyromonas sp.]|nr:acyltransferase family protein [Porphyromonas sp.]
MSKYRADIDGLRAIAVLSVVIFHLHGAWLPSGFLGVDIFFVISGFLITSIIYRDIQGGSFTFKDFYLRRIKRILPVFFVVLFTAILVGIFLMPVENNFVELKKSALASTFFAANLYFMRGGGYFDPNLEDKPFLHIWSLSVEEQFYFVFPILLILLLRYEWSRKYKYPILLSLGAATLGLSFVSLEPLGIDWDTYYMPHLRVPEMLVGALLAMAWSDGLLRKFEDKLASRLSLLCLAVLFVCFFLTGVFVPPFFPGVASLIPCIAAAGLLYLNAQPTSSSRLLSNAFVVWIGKISYSLYLWHWVVLAWFRYVYGVGPLEPQQLVVASLLMLFLSVLSYYFVEQPTRHWKVSFRLGASLYYLLPATLVLLLYFVPAKVYHKSYLPIEYTSLGTTEGMLFNKLRGPGLLGDKSKTPTVLIAGDSHAAHLGVFFDEVGTKEGWCAYTSAASSNPFFFDYVYPYKGNEKLFVNLRNQHLSKIYRQFDIIVLPVHWGNRYYELDDWGFKNALFYTLERLSRENKKVYLVNSLSEVRSERQVEYYLYKKGISIPSSRDVLGDVHRLSVARTSYIKETVQKRFPQVRWVDLTKYLPDDLFYEGKPILQNETHLNAYGARSLAKEFLKHGDRLIEP